MKTPSNSALPSYVCSANSAPRRPREQGETWKSLTNEECGHVVPSPRCCVLGQVKRYHSLSFVLERLKVKIRGRCVICYPAASLSVGIPSCAESRLAHEAIIPTKQAYRKARSTAQDRRHGVVSAQPWMDPLVLAPTQLGPVPGCVGIKLACSCCNSLIGSRTHARTTRQFDGGGA